jgi:hypothetical protein
VAAKASVGCPLFLPPSKQSEANQLVENKSHVVLIVGKIFSWKMPRDRDPVDTIECSACPIPLPFCPPFVVETIEYGREISTHPFCPSPSVTLFGKPREGNFIFVQLGSTGSHIKSFRNNRR